MCGISAVYGRYAPLKAIYMVLHQLERGTLGAGVAYTCSDGIKVVKEPMHPKAFMVFRMRDLDVESWSAIGHNRMPSQGEVAFRNTHPFLSCDGGFALAHNGHAFVTGVREWLVRRGHRVMGETDSEVLCHLLEEYLEKCGDMVEALRMLVRSYLSGVVVVVDREGVLYCARSGFNRAYYGFKGGEFYLASTVKAVRSLLGGEAEVYMVEDRQVIMYRRGQLHIS